MKWEDVNICMLNDEKEGVPGGGFGKWHEPGVIMWSKPDGNRFLLKK